MKLTPKAKKSLEKVIEKFEKGDLSVIKQIASFSIPANAPARKWSTRNKLLAVLQGNTVDCRGSKQWAKVGRHHIKDGRAVYIYAPRIHKDKETDEETIYGFWLIPVFPAHATDGDALEGIIDSAPPPLSEVAEAWGIPVRKSSLEGANGFYSNAGKIVLGTNDVRTFFHELAHAAHHKIVGDGVFNVLSDEPEKELVAEVSASAIAGVYGYDYSGKSWSYIKHYYDDPMTAVLKYTQIIADVIELIFKQHDELQASGT